MHAALPAWQRGRRKRLRGGVGPVRRDRRGVSIGPCSRTHTQSSVVGRACVLCLRSFAYQRHGYLGTGPAFWRAIRRRLCAPGGTVVVNTLYDTRDEMERLAADLREAGWKDVQRRVDRGLQARLWGRKTVAVHEWRPCVPRTARTDLREACARGSGRRDDARVASCSLAQARQHDLLCGEPSLVVYSAI